MLNHFPTPLCALIFTALLLLAAPTPAWTQTAQENAPEENSAAMTAPQREAARADIARQRSDLQKRQQEQEAQCHRRFAVQDCLNHVRSQFYLQRKALDTRAHQINAQERQERAAVRLREIERRLKARQQQGASELHTHTRESAPAVRSQP